MKVILSEEQLRDIIFEERFNSVVGCLLEGKERDNAKNIIRGLSGETSPRTIFSTIANQLKRRSITFMAVPLILGMLMGGGIERSGLREKMTQKLEAVWQNIKNKDSQVTTQMKQDADPNYEAKVKAIQEYMAMAAKNQNYNPNSIQVSPEKMVDACNRNGFDLPLLLAQAHLESCFGLTPRARRTNSVFSVGSYDNGKDACTYASQDDSIEPYIKLMKDNYLRDRSVDDILRPGEFTNGAKKRYASDKGYERKVASIRNKIRTKYPVLAS